MGPALGQQTLRIRGIVYGFRRGKVRLPARIDQRKAFGDHAVYGDARTS